VKPNYVFNLKLLGNGDKMAGAWYWRRSMPWLWRLIVGL